jgi:cytolysin (calcineurin-like family phosphatase)
MPEWVTPIAIVAGNVLNIVFTLITARGRASKEVTDGLQRQINDLSVRVTRSEEAARHAPTDATIERLADKIAEMHGDNQEMKGSLNALVSQVEMIQTFLLQKGAK